ncbi:alpha/beta-hydrolase [Trichoderma citrinoviride]|uniref:Alpha/beta-hydrolase n=1 Tax=Trichoderma citrinoviride TaxID=58853 RepID=A0A2T4BMD9_9HYPO|nr:alpha/beta-hydrolase [Trichoderma citrinoviride]PTB70429.1 alpha/beta-hydrolase [Trichoderma citrinoviride]
MGEKVKLYAFSLFVAPWIFAFVCARFSLYALRNNLNVPIYLLNAGTRVLMGHFTAREIQTLLPSTEEVYRAWIRRKQKLVKDSAMKERLQCDIQPLPEANSSILWVGNRHKAQKVVLYHHGGGYMMSCQPGHIESVWNAFVLSGVESDTEVAVAFLQYSLTPDEKPPVQLRQAASALSELLKAGFSPRDIVVGGDSAGGNLTMQLLHHIIEPHPEASRLSLTEPLFAAALTSPWLSCEVSSPSFLEHDGDDMLSTAIMRSLAADAGYHEDQIVSDEGDSWAKPLECRGTWLSKLNSAVKRVHITIGEREILADQGRALAKNLEALKTGVEVTLWSNPNAGHDLIVAEGVLERIGEATIEMKQWFKELL